MNEKVKKRTYEILDIYKPGDIVSRYFDYFMMTLISLNVLAVILETLPNLIGLTVAITADHGELIGEENMYAHHGERGEIQGSAERI